MIYKVAFIYLTPVDSNINNKLDSVSIKPVLLKEGVEQAKEIQTNPLFNFDYVGNFRREISKDGSQTLFTFTRDPQPKDKSKEIDPKHEFISYVLNSDEFDLQVLYTYCATFNIKKKPELSLYDTVKVTIGKKKIHTTVGRLVINRVLFKEVWENPQFEFVNHIMYQSDFTSALRNVLFLQIEGKVPKTSVNTVVSRYGEFILRVGTVFNASCTYEMLNPDEKFQEFRNKTIDPIAEEVKETCNVSLLEEKEKEVIEYAKKHFENDDMYEIYISKGKAQWDNDFKAMHIDMGALPSITGGKPSIITRPLTDGMKIEDIPALVRTGAMGKVHTSAPSLW